MPKKIDKPWGYEETVFTTDVSSGDDYETLAVRKGVINTDEMTSYHYHKKTNQVIYINKGTVELRLDDSMKELNEGGAFFIEKETPYQIQNISKEAVEIIIVCYPFYPDDKSRIEDPYREMR